MKVQSLRAKREFAEKVVHRLSQNLMRLLRPARVKGVVWPPVPGALRIGEEEEEAAVEAVRAVVRSRRLFRYYGIHSNPFEPSKVRELEKRFAGRIGTKQALAVSSGTTALVCGLAGLGIGPGDEVIVPAYTAFASVSAILAVGAVPILAEIDESLTLDPEDVRQKISPYTRAIMAVHMRGAACDMTALGQIAQEHGLKIIEDVAQANGATYKGRALGSIGDVGTFSFQFTKVMTSGEGGMLTTNDIVLYRRASMYHDPHTAASMGIPRDQWLPGLNFRMSELQGAVALAQLSKVDEIVDAMRRKRRLLENLVRDVLDKKGIRTRYLHDSEGEVAIAFVFYPPERRQVKPIVDALSHDRVRAIALYRGGNTPITDMVDFHVYPAWGALMNKYSWSPHGGPWRWHKREVVYTPDICPRTLDLLSRAVHVDIHPELTDQQVGEMSDSIRSALERFC
jgi:dTDP-4-amino-4,6-dideoxygalactose transaminase